MEANLGVFQAKVVLIQKVSFRFEKNRAEHFRLDFEW